MQHTLQHLFKKSSLEEVPLAALKELVREHPYFATGHLLLAKKLQQQGNNRDFAKQLQKATLYFHDPLWLDHLMTEKQESIASPVEEAVQLSVAPEKATGNEGDALLFEPYHTIDYFASQGIKLSQDPQPDDKLGKQLKSFTEWLKTLRRLPEAVIEETTGNEEPPGGDFSHVEEIAAHSLEEKEVVTEAMAEVLLLQGKKEKALAVYDKLSLLNPDKRAYFAGKIKELNEH